MRRSSYGPNAPFSPVIMGAYKTIDAKISGSRIHASGIHKMFQWQGTYTQWLEHLRAMHADTTESGDKFRDSFKEHHSEWSGFERGITPVETLKTGIIPSAVKDFNTAIAKIDAHKLPGDLFPAVAGGAWVIPLVLANNPLPARMRIRSKLPPQSLDLCVNVWAGIEAKDVSASMARIAKACWQYILAGGAVTLTVHYVNGFNVNRDDCIGAIHSIRVPLTNVAALASACSVQQYRGIAIPVDQGLSGDPDDGLPLVKWERSGLLHVSGRLADDKQAREQLRIADAPHAP